jgi:hypothetical protein
MDSETNRTISSYTFYQVTTEAFTWHILNLNGKSWKPPEKSQEIFYPCSVYLMAKQYRTKQRKNNSKLRADVHYLSTRSGAAP